MDIRRDIFVKHIADAALEQLASEYQHKGYEIITDPPIGATNTNLFVKKGQDAIVFEVKAGEWTAQQRQHIKQVRQKAIHELGAKFKIVLVNLPEESDIEIAGLEDLFFELLPQHFVSEFSEWAAHTSIEKISDIKIRSISIRENEIEIKGEAMVILGLHYGSNGASSSENRGNSSESLPFYFHLLLDKNNRIKELYHLGLNQIQESN